MKFILFFFHRKKRISTKDLAMFVNAMTVACINPNKFFGLNVITELRKRVDSNNHTNPFFLLALCIGGGNMSTEDVHKLQQLFYAHLRPSWTGENYLFINHINKLSVCSMPGTLTYFLTFQLFESQIILICILKKY